MGFMGGGLQKMRDWEREREGTGEKERGDQLASEGNSYMWLGGLLKLCGDVRTAGFTWVIYVIRLCIKTGRSCPSTYPSILTLVSLGTVWTHQLKEVCVSCWEGEAFNNPEAERRRRRGIHGPLRSHHRRRGPAASSPPYPRGFFARTCEGQSACDS